MDTDETTKHPYKAVLQEHLSRKAKLGKHAAANAATCRRIIDHLDSIGESEAADWAIWMVWWRLHDKQVQKHINANIIWLRAELDRESSALAMIGAILSEADNLDDVIESMKGLTTTDIVKGVMSWKDERRAARDWLRGQTELGDPTGRSVCSYCGEMLTGREEAIEHCRQCPENPLVQEIARLTERIAELEADPSTN